MAYDEMVADRVRRTVSGRPGVSEKKMMGALVFLVNGSMCCGVSGTALMIRVGPEVYEQTLAQPHVRPMEIGGRRTSGFVRIDPEGYRADGALARWVQQGLDFASTVPTKRPAARKPRPKAPRT